MHNYYRQCDPNEALEECTEYHVFIQCPDCEANYKQALREGVNVMVGYQDERTPHIIGVCFD